MVINEHSFTSPFQPATRGATGSPLVPVAKTLIGGVAAASQTLILFTEIPPAQRFELASTVSAEVLSHHVGGDFRVDFNKGVSVIP